MGNLRVPPNGGKRNAPSVTPSIVNENGRTRIQTKNGTFVVSDFVFGSYIPATQSPYDGVELKNGVRIYVDDISQLSKMKTAKLGDAKITVDAGGNIFVKDAADVGIISVNGQFDNFGVHANDSNVTVRGDKDIIESSTTGEGKITFTST